MTIPSDTPTTKELSEIGLFGGLDESTIAEFVQRLPVLRLSPGDVVFREGDAGRELFVLLQGEMEVIKHSKTQRESRVAIFGPGDWFGEMSILDIMPRSATVRALAPSRVLKMSAHSAAPILPRAGRAASERSVRLYFFVTAFSVAPKSNLRSRFAIQANHRSRFFCMATSWSRFDW